MAKENLDENLDESLDESLDENLDEYLDESLDENLDETNVRDETINDTSILKTLRTKFLAKFICLGVNLT